MNVAIIGCGFIGRKRAKCLGEHKLVAVADIVQTRAQALAQEHPGATVMHWQDVVKSKDVEAVVVSTTHDSLSTITFECVASGKHVLVDKPAARNAKELDPVLDLLDGSIGRIDPSYAGSRNNPGRPKVRVGFNHRYHGAVQKAKELIDAGAVGEMMFLRARYGHGGRTGYEKEWRADPEVSGGGELLDQGMHLIDLSRWMLGEFPHVEGYVNTYFWQMPVEDNAFALLRTERNQVAWLHVSWTEWKNLFSLELYGKTGKLHIEGLGGSYGEEQLTFYRMLPEMGPPEIETWQFPEDNSWAIEFNEFVRDINEDRIVEPGLGDAHAALTIVQKIYEKSRESC